MKRLLIIACLFASPASAQQAVSTYSGLATSGQASFVPYTMNEDDHNRIMAYLGDQPAKIAIPLLQVLTTLEAKAINTKMAEAAKEAEAIAARAREAQAKAAAEEKNAKP